MTGKATLKQLFSPATTENAAGLCVCARVCTQCDGSETD